jgi:hypothetical protein
MASSPHYKLFYLIKQNPLRSIASAIKGRTVIPADSWAAIRINVSLSTMRHSSIGTQKAMNDQRQVQSAIRRLVLEDAC